MTSYTWKGSGPSHTGTWETAPDWSPNGVPGISDSVSIFLGTATEDVNRTSGSGIEISSLYIGVSGSMAIGDAAGTNFSVVQIDGTAPTTIIGKLTVYAGGTSGSQLIASGTLKTQVASHLGEIDLKGGNLVVRQNLTLQGAGKIAMTAGKISASAAFASSNLYNLASSVISGTGVVDGSNGLRVVNRGLVEASGAVASGTDGLTLSGGIFYNYTTLQATNSASGGIVNFVMDNHVIVNNTFSGVMNAGTGAQFVLNGGTIYNGTLIGALDVQGTGNTIAYYGTQVGAGFVNKGTITVDGDLTINAGPVRFSNENALITVTGNLTINNTLDNNNGHIVVNGTASTPFGGAILNGNGNIEIGGLMTINNGVLGGRATLNGGELIVSYPDNMDVYFNGGTLGLKGIGSAGENFNFQTGDFIDLLSVPYTSSETGVFTQVDANVAFVQVGGHTFLFDGSFAAARTTYTFGAPDGSGHFALTENFVDHSTVLSIASGA